MRPRRAVGDHLSGSLLGLCLGDALGAAVEGHPPEDARRYVNEELKHSLRRALPRGRGSSPFGQYTDDSQLARELLISLTECPGFDPADFASRVASLVRDGRLVGGGPGTLSTAERLLGGVPWEEAAVPPPYAGNGCAMRVGPIGVLYAADSGRMIETAVRQSRVTHQEPRCAAGAVAIAGATALASRRESIDSAGFLDQLAEWTEPIAPGFGLALKQVGGWLTLPPAAVSAAAVTAGLEPPSAETRWEGGISPFVTASVGAALYAFLRSPDDYWETVCTAISIGGDTDTLAAMAGSISGARLGLDAIPQSLMRALNDQGTWGFDELISLATTCVDAVGRG